MNIIKNKIRQYNNMVDKNFVSERHLQKTINISRNIVSNRDADSISYMEFIYQQSVFIKKKWWILQALILFIIWLMLRDSGEELYTQRLLGIGSPIFAIFLLPEMWRNITNSSTEIEGASYYSLSRIYSARIILFALADITLITIFFISTSLPIETFVINFVIPFNVCCCISFNALCKPKNKKEYAVVGFITWTIIWISVSSNNYLYNTVIVPIWIILLGMSFGYLVCWIKKVTANSTLLWEGI